MAIDRMDWHYGGNYPADLPQENAGTHIGMFIQWAFAQGLASEFHRQENADGLNALLHRENYGRDFLIEYCDEKFTNEELNEIGNDFAAAYYDDDTPFAVAYGSYLDDYIKLFEKDAHGRPYASTYHVENTQENYARLKPLLNQRYQEWQTWCSNPQNKQNAPRIIFQQASLKIAEALKPHGFKANKIASKLKRTSRDKRLQFELCLDFQNSSSTRNILMLPYMRVSSKALKQWQIEQTGSPYHTGMTASLHLVDFVDAKTAFNGWNIAQQPNDTIINALINLINNHFLPVLERFDDTMHAVDLYAQQGMQWLNPKDNQGNFSAMPFMLFYGEKSQAQRYFSLELSRCHAPLRTKITELYQTLSQQNKKDINLNLMEFYGASSIRMAFVHDLQLENTATPVKH